MTQLNIQHLNARQAAEAVTLFNAEYSEMEKALHCLAEHCRASLLCGNNKEVVEALVWTIKSWWGVQGVRSETKALAAQALFKMKWTQDDFTIIPGSTEDGVKYAVDRVSELVSSMMGLGVGRQEFSLSSKVLHWLTPNRVPVYDSFVRKSIGIPTRWDHKSAYEGIVHWQLTAIQQLSSEGKTWCGEVVPLSPFRALDKYLWWLGGGANSRAVVAREPFRIVQKLGLAVNNE